MLPLDDRRFERFNPDLAGRPQLIQRQLAAPVRRDGPPDRELDPQHEEQVARDHGARSWCPRAARAASSSPRAARSAAGASTLKDGEPAYCYNLFGLQRFKVDGDAARFRRRAPGTHGVRLRRRRARQGRRRHALRRRHQVGEGRVEATVPMLFSADETTDVGSDTGTPVSDDYGPATTNSPARPAGSRSTSTRPPRTPTT